MKNKGDDEYINPLLAVLITVVLVVGIVGVTMYVAGQKREKYEILTTHEQGHFSQKSTETKHYLNDSITTGELRKETTQETSNTNDEDESSETRNEITNYSIKSPIYDLLESRPGGAIPLWDMRLARARMDRQG